MLERFNPDHTPEFAANAQTAFPLGRPQSQTGFGFAAHPSVFAIAT
jgi:hypothetical protein